MTQERTVCDKTLHDMITSYRAVGEPLALHRDGKLLLPLNGELTAEELSGYLNQLEIAPAELDLVLELDPARYTATPLSRTQYGRLVEQLSSEAGVLRRLWVVQIERTVVVVARLPETGSDLAAPDAGGTVPIPLGTKAKASVLQGDLLDLPAMDLPQSIALSNALTDVSPQLDHLTDLGNAEAFAALYGEDARYVPAWNKWMVWTAGRWQVGEDTGIRSLAHEFVGDVLPMCCNEHPEGEAARHLKKSRNSGGIGSLLSVAEPLMATDPKRLDADRMLLNCLNGTLDLRTGGFRKHRREDLLTKQSPVVYDREAKCPTWDAFLDQVLAGADSNPRPELKRYVQKAAGYSITGLTREQCFFIAWGHGRNGKSTFLEALLHLAGVDEYGTVTQQDVLMMSGKRGGNSDDVADLCGVRFAMCSETSDGERIDEQKIKRLTGTNTIKAMRKYEHAFSFPATHTIWLDCNHKPRIMGTDTGIKRRVKLIPFEVQIPEHDVDHDLATKLEAEASGILNWLLDGIALYMAEGLDEPECVKAATEDYLDENDTLGGFLDDCVELTDEEELDWEATQTIFMCYQEWCERMGIQRSYVLTQRSLTNKLKDRGFQIRRKAEGRGFSGIRVRDKEHLLRGMINGRIIPRGEWTAGSTDGPKLAG